MERYVFGSAQFRAKEVSLIGNERIVRLLEAGNLSRAIALLSEFGVRAQNDPKTGAFSREETLLGRLRETYAALLEVTENAEFLKLWLYPYDCNNIKAAIKCARRGIDPADLTFDFGTVELGDILYMAQTGDFEKLPKPFGDAAREASEAFSRTANPQWVDLILDRACYAAMLSSAKKSGVELAVRLVERKIDLTNLLTCIRLLRMRAGDAGESMLQNAFIEGGTLDVDEVMGFYRMGEANLWHRLEFSAYAPFAAAAGGEGATLTRVETAADNFFMELVKESKMIPYGAEPLIGYLIAAEFESRNLRIILAGFEAELDADTLRERIRNSYV